MNKSGLENKIITLEDLTKKLSEMSDDNFKVALLFNSYFKSNKEIMVNNLIRSERHLADIGVIDYLGLLTIKINLIQEERDEG